MTDAQTPPPGDVRAELRLRPEQPRVTRLSRKVLITLGGVSAVAIMAALFWALDANRRASQSPNELYNTENRTPADGLAGLPKDYTGVPRLGPALPGDLGRPILSAQDEGKPVIAPDIRTPRADPAEQRRLAEIEAARVAKVFTDSSGVQASVTPTAAAVGRIDPTTGLTLPTETPPLDPGAAQNMQDRKLAFVNAAVDRRTVTPDRVQEKASPYVVQAGTVIPAALITGIKSDLPGTITAQVTEQVYDTPTGKQLLIPQGARLNPVIYRARSRFQPGTERWDRILLALMLPVMVAEIPVATLDAGRMFWSAVPFSIVVLGYVLIVAGIALGAWAQAVNRFFEPGVRIQRERGQHVITSGPYQFVRHPGYVSAIMIFVGVPLSLASWWALIPAAFASAILILRTSWEDELLRAELEGYADYARRTPFRLAPGIW